MKALRPFERFMALRYLRGAEGRAEGRGFLRFVMAVAVGGVAVGVAALLLALSIVHGFSSEIERKIIGFGAHVQVQSAYREEPLTRADQKRRQLQALPSVTHVEAVVEDFALLRRSAREIDGVAFRGTDAPPDFLRERLVAGTLSFAPDSAGRPGVLVGRQMARRLGLAVGGRVTAFSLPGAEGAAGSATGGAAFGVQPRVKQFHVAGIFETALGNFDDLYVFADLEHVRAFLGFDEDAVTRFDLTLADPSRADSVAVAAEEALGFPTAAVTIYQAFSGLFAWVNLQESITPLVIAVIILVAAFNIVGALLMLMLEKTREIGVLSSLGASARAVRRLFLWVGLLIGAVGTLLGQALALALALIQQRYEVIPLPAEAYYMTSAPVELHVLDFVVVGAVTLALCALAAYVPARIAARIDPVRAIRFR